MVGVRRGAGLPESRQSVTASRAVLRPGAVVAGHKDPTQGNPPAVLAESRGYLDYYGQLREAGLPNQDLFEAVVSHYPHRVRRQQFLILGSCESWYRPL